MAAPGLGQCTHCSYCWCCWYRVDTEVSATLADCRRHLYSTLVGAVHTSSVRVRKEVTALMFASVCCAGHSATHLAVATCWQYLCRMPWIAALLARTCFFVRWMRQRRAVLFSSPALQVVADATNGSYHCRRKCNCVCIQPRALDKECCGCSDLYQHHPRNTHTCKRHNSPPTTAVAPRGTLTDVRLHNSYRTYLQSLTGQPFLILPMGTSGEASVPYQRSVVGGLELHHASKFSISS